jgi:hypothetical protein
MRLHFTVMLGGLLARQREREKRVVSRRRRVATEFPDAIGEIVRMPFSRSASDGAGASNPSS